MAKETKMSKIAFLKKLLAGADPESQWPAAKAVMPSAGPKPRGEFDKIEQHAFLDNKPDDIQKARNLLTHKKFIDDADASERADTASAEKFAKILALLAGGAIAGKSALSEEEE